MTPARRAAVVATVVLLAAAGCGRAEGVRDTRRALERAGYAQVEVTVRSGGGLDVVRVAAAGAEPDRAAEVVWTTLPVRFDQLLVTLGASGTPYRYDALAERFGPRDPDLDRQQVTDQVVRDGLDLMLLLTLGALLSVGGVVTLAWLAMRTARGRRPAPPDDQAEGPISGPGAASLTAEEPGAAAAGPEAIPS